MWLNYGLVFVGGGVGSLLRYAFGLWFGASTLPKATFAANILACFIIGVLSGLYLRGQLNDTLRLLLVTGFCGGFSTFSTFSNETLQLLQQNHVSLAAANVVFSVFGCLLATFLGLIFFVR